MRVIMAAVQNVDYLANNIFIEEECALKCSYDTKLREFYESHSKTEHNVKKPWTSARISQVIQQIKESRVTTQRKSMDYYWLSKYEVLETADEEILIFKKKCAEDPTISIIPMDKYFETLTEIHKAIGHGGRQKVNNHIKNKLYIPKRAIEIFVELCSVREMKRSVPKKETKCRVTAAQTDVLCTFFEENPEVIRGYKKTPQCIDDVQHKWQKITPHLNSLGPARNHKAWAKYLCDMKAKLKRKRIKWRQKSDGTGPIICNADDFNEITLRMLQVLRKDTISLQESHESDLEMEDDPKNERDLEMEDDPKNEQDDVNYEIEVFPPQQFKNNKSKNPAYIKLPNTPPPEHKAQFIVPQHESNDEFDTFGRNVAQQLKSLPLPVALETQEILLSVIRKQRIKVLSETYSSIDPLDNQYGLKEEIMN